MAVDADSARQLTESTDYENGDADSHQATTGDADRPARHNLPGLRVSMGMGLAIVVAVGGLAGWLGYRAYQSYFVEQQRALFLQVGRQAALNLTTISHTQADADVQRILDSATGTFYDDFHRRAPAFVQVVKQAQSTSEGSVTAAGVESEQANQAEVLVALSVKTSIAGAPQQEPRAWRMRISVQKIGDDAKVSNVRFVA